MQLYSQFDPESITYNVPADGWWNNVYAYNLMRLKRFDEAVEVLGYVPSEVTDGWYSYTLITAYILNGNHDLLALMLDEMESKDFSWLSVTYMYMYTVGLYTFEQNDSQRREWSQRLLSRVDEEQSSLDIYVTTEYAIVQLIT